jgi:predicted amidohydrolase
MAPSPDKEANLRLALSLVDEALERYRHVDVVCLPELFYQDPPPEEVQDIGPIPAHYIEAFRERAKRGNTYIVAGSIANRCGDRIFNTALLFDRRGEIVGSYDKVHLFDALGIRESDVMSPGSSLLVHQADFGKIGVVICYDIRFPELARTLALKGVEYLFVPTAFYSPRLDHWTDLVRITALQNLFYVIGANLFGTLRPGEAFCGRSTIADPWGVALATAPDRSCFIHAYLDPAYLRDVRERVGGYTNRVPSIYEIT